MSSVPIVLAIASLINISLAGLLPFTKCPDPSLISPCQCNEYDAGWGYYQSFLKCGGNEAFDLGSVMSHFKRIYRLEISNTGITEIKANDIADIDFFELSIYNCSSLTKISKDALGHNGTKPELFFSNNPLVDPQDVIDLANSFNLKGTTTLYNISEIPSRAFHVPEHHIVTYLHFGGERLNKIGSRAFEDVDSYILQVNITDSSIETIPDFAFAYKKDSLYIGLKNNRKLSADSFAENAFKVGSNTVTGISFDPIVSYLDEKAFKTFFDDNTKNTIEIVSGKLDCSDVKNNWLKSYSDRFTRGYHC